MNVLQGHTHTYTELSCYTTQGYSDTSRQVDASGSCVDVNTDISLLFVFACMQGFVQASA